MTHFQGKLVLDEDNIPCVKMQLSPQNPTLYDIPLSELLEEFVDKEIYMEVFRVETRAEVLD
ncbi:hypothetical protein GF325_16910 [Candidatus Bathyarchaeota archaeon]|nr:hypothetical protein [Candidatus Bathyarchaeota archaeon]